MTVTIKINDITLCHKGSGGVARSTLPDLCKTPPNALPVAYVNVAKSSDLAKGTKTVKADGGSMCAINGSEFSCSTGDEAGSLGGVLSGTNLAEATWITHSFDVMFEGQGACRLTDKMFLNKANSACLSGLYQLDFATDDPVKYAMCQILCETLDDPDVRKSKKPGKYSEHAKKLGRGKYKVALDNAAKKAFGKGSKVALEKGAKVAYKKNAKVILKPETKKVAALKGVMRETKRKAMSRDWLERKTKNKVLQAAAKGAGKKIATKVVLKFIPIVNIASTAFDVYELSKGAAAIQKEVEKFMANYDIYRIRPDTMMVTGPSGQAHLYDYKFGPDSFSKNPGQKELYNAAAGGQDPIEISEKECGDCKKKGR